MIMAIRQHPMFSVKISKYQQVFVFNVHKHVDWRAQWSSSDRVCRTGHQWGSERIATLLIEAHTWSKPTRDSSSHREEKIGVCVGHMCLYWSLWGKLSNLSETDSEIVATKRRIVGFYFQSNKTTNTENFVNDQHRGVFFITFVFITVLCLWDTYFRRVARPENCGYFKLQIWVTNSEYTSLCSQNLRFIVSRLHSMFDQSIKLDRF